MRLHLMVAASLLLLAAWTLTDAGAETTPEAVGTAEEPATEAPGPVAHITHEVPTSGETYVENLNRFGWTVLDQDGQPIPHLDATFTLEQNGTTLFSTSPSSGHDYDAIDRYWTSQFQEGSYNVSVEVPYEGDTLQDDFQGTVHEATMADATLDHDLPDSATAGAPLDLTYAVEDDEGTPIEHAHVLLEAWDRDEDRRILQTTTHGHDGAHEATVAFPSEGSYELRLTAYHAYPTEKDTPFSAFSTSHEITVESGDPLLPGTPTREPLENTVEQGQSEDPYELFVTFDPYTSTGPQQKMRIGGVIVDPSDLSLVEHADVTTTITAPDGTQLLQADGHSYDGVVEVEISPPVEGDYEVRFQVESTRTDWTGSHEASFSAHAPAVPLYAGDYFVDLEGPRSITAGSPGSFTFEATDRAGEPYDHSEIAMSVVDPNGDLTFAGKLHTHADGRFPFTLTFPSAGPFTIEADAFALMPSPVLDHHGPTMGEAPTFEVTVDQEDGPSQASDEDEPAGAPFLGLPASVATIAATVLAYARRKGR